MAFLVLESILRLWLVKKINKMGIYQKALQKFLVKGKMIFYSWLFAISKYPENNYENSRLHENIGLCFILGMVFHNFAVCSIIHASLSFVQGRLLPWNTITTIVIWFWKIDLTTRLDGDTGSHNTHFRAWIKFYFYAGRKGSAIWKKISIKDIKSAKM